MTNSLRSEMKMEIRSKSLQTIQTFDANLYCKQCQGGCCKTHPGESSPDDFSVDGELQWNLVRSSLKTGHWCVDWWEGNPEKPDDLSDYSQSFFIRPNVRDYSGTFSPSFGFGFTGPCTFLGENGCTSSIKPFGCKTLKPKADFDCHHESHPDFLINSRHLSALLWKKYSSQLYNLAQNLEGD